MMRNFLDDTFPRFWNRELDIEDISVITDCLQRAGADTGDFEDYADNKGRELHDTFRQEAWDFGIFGVPTFRIDDELFFGSEQIPLVRWHLQGSPEGGPG